MQETKSIRLTLVVLALVLSACSARSTQAPPTSAPTMTEPGDTPSSMHLPQSEMEVPRISVEEARVALESGAAVIIDVRNPNAFETSHIAGAVSVPLGQIERDLASVPLQKDQWIITYCT